MGTYEEPIKIFYYADLYNAFKVPAAKVIQKNRANKNSITIGGGDFFGSGVFSPGAASGDASVDRGEFMLEALCDLETEICAIGNHEIDHGVVRMLELFKMSEDRVARGQKAPQFICSNLTFKDTSQKYLEAAGATRAVIHDSIIKEIGGKRIGFFALLDKNNRLTTRWGPNGLKEFDECFDLNPKVQDVAHAMVAKLESQGCDMIVAIAHMDGYYTVDQLNDESRWKPEELNHKWKDSERGDAGSLKNSNTFDIVVPGVNLVLDASNHEAICEVLPRDKRVTSLGGITAKKMPSYCMGGVELDFLNEIVLNYKDITSCMCLYMHDTNHIPQSEFDMNVVEKYERLAKAYVTNPKYPIVNTFNHVTLKHRFDLTSLRYRQEPELTKILYNILNQELSAPRIGVGPVDCAFFPGGMFSPGNGNVPTFEHFPNDRFSTYTFLGIFAKGVDLVVFKTKKKLLQDYLKVYLCKISSTEYPQLQPKPKGIDDDHCNLNDVNYPKGAVDDNSEIQCATTKGNFDALQKQAYFAGAMEITRVDLCKVLNDQRYLLDFGAPIDLSIPAGKAAAASQPSAGMVNPFAVCFARQ